MLKKLISWCHTFGLTWTTNRMRALLHQSIHDAHKVYLMIQRFNKITGEIT